MFLNHSLHRYGKTSVCWDSEITVTVIILKNKVIIIIDIPGAGSKSTETTSINPVFWWGWITVVKLSIVLRSPNDYIISANEV